MSLCVKVASSFRQRETNEGNGIDSRAVRTPSSRLLQNFAAIEHFPLNDRHCRVESSDTHPLIVAGFNRDSTCCVHDRYDRISMIRSQWALSIAALEPATGVRVTSLTQMT
jgi:hypothetical protein